jgi:signal transduction histidine kinase
VASAGHREHLNGTVTPGRALVDRHTGAGRQQILSRATKAARRRGLGEALRVAASRSLARMSEAANTTRQSLDALLLLSRAQTRELEFVAVDLTRVMRAVRLGATARLQETGGSLSVGDLPVIQADSSQMHQLFQNLVDNSLKFVHEGVPPCVTIHAEVLPAYADRLNVGGELCRIYVEDGGVGFHECDGERMFAPLGKAPGSPEEGAGIGLAVCRAIADQHGGTISARSCPGQGSTFIVELPLRQAASALGRSERPIVVGKGA